MCEDAAIMINKSINTVNCSLRTQLYPAKAANKMPKCKQKRRNCRECQEGVANAQMKKPPELAEAKMSKKAKRWLMMSKRLGTK
jgi:hypothetical protein